MTSTQKTITLTDAAGEPHDYMLTQHPAFEGTALLMKLASVGGGPLGQILEGADLGGAGLLDSEGSGAAVGEGIKLLAANLMDAGGPDLIKQVFRYTVRDNEKMDSAFNSAFQGNYGELLAAFAWVLWANFGSVTKAPFGTVVEAARS